MIQLQSGKWPPRFTDEVLDYQVDWTLALGDDDSLTTVTVTATNGQEVFDLSTTGNVTTLWIRNGEEKNAPQAHVHLLAETAGGRKLGLNITLPIQRR